MPSLSLLIVEDEPVLRLGLKMSLQKNSDLNCVGEATDGEAAVREALRLKPQVIIMDIGLPGLNGIEATWRIKQDLPQTRIIMLTSHTSQDYVMAALGAGADGFCSKEASLDQINQAIGSVMKGVVWLEPSLDGTVVQKSDEFSERLGVALSADQIEVLSLIREGQSLEGLADQLYSDTTTIGRTMLGILKQMVHSSNFAATAKISKENAEPAGANNSQEELSTDLKPIGFSNEWYAAVTHEPEKGTVFAEKYAFEQLLGSGGIGAVFKARHLFMDRSVALKVLRADLAQNPLVLRNFQKEARAVASMQHQNVINVYDFGISPSREPYLVMEYVDGKDLASIIDMEKQLPLRRLHNIAVQICYGLMEAHEREIIHCDLKPSNILIRKPSKGTEIVKLVDFGLAQIVPRKANIQSQMTDRYFVDGTPAYMAPEQIDGKALDGRTDIYALGCVLYEAITGRNPFLGETPVETFANQCAYHAPAISKIADRNIPKVLDQCISAMLEKHPERRPQSMKEVLCVLQAVAPYLEDRPN